MDPSLFLQYSPPSNGLPPNGLPQESKLATYMNRSATTPTRSMTHALSKVSLEPSPSSSLNKGLGVGGEFVPMNYYSPPMTHLSHSPGSSPPNALATMIPNPPQVHQENVGGTTYFYPTTADSLNSVGAHNSSVSMGVPDPCMGVLPGPSGPIASPYASQMYSTPPPHINPTLHKSGLAASFYTPDTIRAEIYDRNEDVMVQPDPRQFPELPENVEMYSDLIPLEPLSHGMTSSYRCTHRQSGEQYAMRRLHAYAAGPAKRLDLWKQIDHPNVARFQEAFTTKAFGDHSLVLVYEYLPACVTLMSKYLTGGAGGGADSNGCYHDPFSSDPDAPRPYTHQKNAMLRAVASGALLPEAVLWSTIVQLTAGMRTVHGAGLACRNLDPTKVVINGCRARMTWLGVADALHSNNNDLGQAQQDDLAALGRLALSMACRTAHCDNLSASMDIVTRSYSADLKNLILYLLSSSTVRRSVTDLMPMIGARFYMQIEAFERRVDAFEVQLSREVDNGRLLRILMKLGMVNERPELNMDSSWSETGDRYMLKLFRDYLFHTVADDGRPWNDQGHIAYCLNQLDSGSSAKVELMSRDEQSVLLVSYAELKHCLEQAVEEVMQAGVPPP